jgi:phosphatidylethanolamine/phosphatidyl-N-methylethanolamine N-methyltransferase
MAAATRDLDATLVGKAYSNWADVYDRLCGPLFRTAHVAAAAAANRVGGRILEIGVGTGLLLPLYEKSTRVTGVDLSPEMLAKARERVSAQGLAYVVALETGDVHQLVHSTASFDVVVMPFVLTLVSAPEVALDSCLRVLRPGGEIIIVSHFRSHTPWIAALESWVAPWIAGAGLRPDFPVSRLADWAATRGNAEITEVRELKPFGIYRLIRITKAV